MSLVKSLYRKLRQYGAGMKGPLRYQISRLGGSPDAYLKLCRLGVIHVGANDGQERFCYAENRLKVVWVEAIPETYQALLRNIESFPGQQAIQALIADRNGDTHTLHISNNMGLSSSIFELQDHKEIWPDVHYVRELSLQSETLGTALARAGVDLAEYEILAMDTQGSELLVLKGAEDILPRFKYIRTEAADFEIYKNCATVKEICEFLEPRGFHLVQKDAFAQRDDGTACYELLFLRNA